MKRIFYLIVSCLLLLACSTGDKNKNHSDSQVKNMNSDTLVYQINVEEGFAANQELKISEIADTIQYLQLKTPKGIIITGIRQVIVTKDYIFIVSRGIPYQFHRDGSFVRQIGSTGNGPGEYLNVRDISIDKENILLWDYSRILYYGLNGNFIQAKNIYGAIAKADTVFWVGTSGAGSSSKQLALAVNSKGDTLCAIANHLYFPSKVGKGGLLSSFKIASKYQKTSYACDSKLFFKGEESNDTIWQLKLPQPEIHAILTLGKYQLPAKDEVNFSSDNFMKHAQDYYGIPRVLEDSRYFYLMVQPRWSTSKEFVYFPMVFDKESQKGFVVKKENSLGITDDILGGPSFWPYFITDEYYIGIVEAYELKDRLHGVKSGYFTRLLASVDENSNQLLILCKKK
jgi:hypothetical protein